jgi:hypothetical protein
MHGCKLRFHAGLGTALSGSVDLTGCETPLSYEYSSAGASCTVEIGNQSGLGTVEYKNTGTPTTVTAIANLANITYTRTGSLCNASTGTFSNGTYKGEWSVKGSAGSEQVPVEVESATTIPTVFAADEAPVKISGQIWKARNIFQFNAGAFECTEHSLSGESSTATMEAIVVSGSYHGCTLRGQTEAEGLSFSMGKCSYELRADGGFGIVGASCASAPITISTPECTYRFGPQSVVGNLRYVNEGSGRLRTVRGRGAAPDVVGGLEYTTSGPSCEQGVGTFTEGYYKAVDKFTATNSSGAPQGISAE